MKINLSGREDIFKDNSLDFTKNTCLIFGRNGTGKSTIVAETNRQCLDTYNVMIYDGFSAVLAENERLDAIALGSENAKLQKDLEDIDEKIKDANESLKTVESSMIAAKNNLSAQENKIDKFYVKSANSIKNYSKAQISKTTYFKNDFKKEISNAKLLSDDKINELLSTTRSEKLQILKHVSAEIIDIQSMAIEVKEILSKEISPTESIDELGGSDEKANFARSGMKLHKVGDRCSFCGGVITNERWKKLKEYFNDEVSKLENRIKECNERIDEAAILTKSFNFISKTQFYPAFRQKYADLENDLRDSIKKYQDELSVLKDKIDKKANSIFSKIEFDNGDISPISIEGIVKEINALIDQNNEYTNNLSKEQNNAKDNIRYSVIWNKLSEFKYETEKAKLKSLKERFTEEKGKFDSASDEMRALKKRRQETLENTVDETRAATEINKALSEIGNLSFKLELKTNVDNQKGQYVVKGYDGSNRSVTEISTGEKNLIGFLYFLYTLKNPQLNSGKPLLVIFDDPMTSNDDISQYLMAERLKELSKEYKNSQNILMVLTHNCHFYLNVKPLEPYKKYSIVHLLSDGKRTSVKYITNGNEDFCTSYELLWKELRFIYESDADPQLLLQCCRRICETYIKFNGIDLNLFYKADKSAKKLFDVNLHAIDDLEANLCAETREEIIEILKGLFANNHAQWHFDKYYPINDDE